MKKKKRGLEKIKNMGRGREVKAENGRCVAIDEVGTY
jgi:hypothetical protein